MLYEFWLGTSVRTTSKALTATEANQLTLLSMVNLSLSLASCGAGFALDLTIGASNCVTFVARSTNPRSRLR